MPSKQQYRARDWPSPRPREPLLTSVNACDGSQEGNTWQDARLQSAPIEASRAARRRSRRVRVGSRLVECFSEFLASRNVMIDRHPSYNKLSSSHRPARYNQNPNCLASKWSIGPQRSLSSSRPSRSRSRTSLLLGALVNGRYPGGKMALLWSLLRAPIVLAALFSLLLAVSLTVLYGLSFVRHLQSTSWQVLNRGPVLAEFQQQVSSHRISSRQVEAAAFSRALTVQTECGSYVGSPDEGGAIVFRRIRYASPPVGHRRWARPRPIWLDRDLCRPEVVWPEQERAPHCAQVSPFTPGQFSGFEDCLYLEIYTPKLGDHVKLLPVMFYIHGGFLAFGSANPHDRVNWLRAGPSGQLASELDVVIVAANYRLQALGFMASEVVADDEQDNNDHNGRPTPGSSANFGLWDQLSALNWVRRNIEQFAGDPNNIVVFGPDSASALVLALLGRPAPSAGLQTDQLYRAAWLTNPTVFYELPVDLARLHYRRIFGSNSVSAPPACANDSSPRVYGGCLMKATGEQVVRQYLGNDDAGYRLDDQNSMPIHGIFADQFVVQDGELVRNSFPFTGPSTGDHQANKKDPANGASSFSGSDRGYNNEQSAAAKQLLLGSSAQAVEFWPCPRMLDQWDWPDFRRYVATSLNSFNTDTYRQASQIYRLEEPNRLADKKAAKLAYLSMVSDIRVTCPTNQLASSLGLQDSQVQRYVVETRPGGKSARTEPAITKLEFAHHMWDLFAFFGFNLEPDFTPSQRDLLFQSNLRSLVRRFVHQTGNKTDQVGRDHQGQKGSGQVTLFAQDGTVRDRVANYKATECAMWRQHLGSAYGWAS